MTRLSDLVGTSTRLASTRSRLAKVEALGERLRSVSPDELAACVAFLSGEVLQSRLGIGPAALHAARETPPANEPSLTLAELDAALAAIAAIGGAGSIARRTEALGALFSRATSDEQRFLARLISGELRQGAQAGLMQDAIARASGQPADAVRRAAMLAGSLPEVAVAAMSDGAAGLSRFAMQLLRPVLPMLAQPADSVDEAVGSLGEAIFDWKIDGARVQVHKADAEIRVFTRNLNDVTSSVPEIVEAVAALPSRALVLDAEAIALRPDGSPYPFQISMSRFARKLDVAGQRESTPLSFFAFDCLHRDGRDLLAEPLAARLAEMDDALPEGRRMPRIVTGEVAAASRFLDQALSHGHEGVMAKGPRSLYAAGVRGAEWLKIKRAHTLDLVVLGAEWGHGRRSGKLSNLHLGARDPATGGFVMLGKTFKGLTDRMLEWQTTELLARETRRDAYTVYVRPELVVEIAFNNVQASPHYPGGLALRFARVKGYRPDKTAAEADTIETVRAFHDHEHRVEE